jgi:signal transduction histidine kinase
MVKILEYKHNLSLELTLSNEWEALTVKLAELPSRLVPNVDEAHLLMGNPISGKFELAACWKGINKGPRTEIWDPTIPCNICNEMISCNKNTLHQCQNDDNKSERQIYNLIIRRHDLPVTMLKFKLRNGVCLTYDERKIFRNIGDEIAAAILAGQAQKRLSELQSAEVAMAERRMVSAYVHDHLGQNLGYLHLKLDQLGKDENIIRSKDIREALSHLREVANDSYEMVRDILKKMQPETIPNLTNLLKEHAVRVSREAKFTLNFRSTGKPIQLPSDTQNTIFYVFREILSNVEKHSKAGIVDVLVTWSDSFLDITVRDNGIGFDAGSVQKDKHFGLEIVQERIAKLNGQLMMNSSGNSGTLVSISVPV